MKSINRLCIISHLFIPACTLVPASLRVDNAVSKCTEVGQMTCHMWKLLLTMPSPENPMNDNYISFTNFDS